MTMFFSINSHCDIDLGPKTLKFKTVQDKRFSGTEECSPKVRNNGMYRTAKEGFSKLTSCNYKKFRRTLCLPEMAQFYIW